MKKQIAPLFAAVIVCGIAISSQAMAKTAKDCTAEWRADKAGMQAKGVTEKAYVDQCKNDSEPAATAPSSKPSASAPPSPSAPKQSGATAGKKTAKDCTVEWRADKAGMQTKGVTEKAYVDQCKGGAEPSVAAPAPKPAAAPPVAAAPTAAAKPQSASPAATPAPTTKPAPTAAAPKSNSSESNLKAGEFADEARAKFRCPTDTVVWANLSSKIYHFSGGKEYGNTKRGAYMCEKDATAADFRAAKNEKHP